MHRKIIEAALQGLEGKRASYFTDIANRLDQNPKIEPMANMVFTVLGDVMGELPIYLEAAELIGLLLEFTAENKERLHRTMYSPGFAENPKIIHAITGEFIVRVVAVTMDEHGELAEETDHGHKQKLTWPYRDTDVVDPEDDPEAWGEAVSKAEAWRQSHGTDRRRRGAGRIDQMAENKDE